MAIGYPSDYHIMADLSDVEVAMAVCVTDALYPSGTSQSSVIGTTCRVYRGWPSPAALNSDLAAGVVNVTIFPANSPDEVLSCYLDTSYSFTSAATLNATTVGDTVTFSGSTTVGDVVGILVDGKAYTYVTLQTDTPEAIAANFAAQLQVDRTSISSGATLSIPGVRGIIARVISYALVARALRRQSRQIQLSCWCPTPQMRDSVCKAVDLAFASISFINLPDGTTAHVRYASSQVYDQSVNALLFRRDLQYHCEYTIVGISTAPVMLFGELIDNASSLTL